MSLGALEETVTVTGEASLVDVQSTRQQSQFQRETLQAIPGTGRITGLANVIPGVALVAPTAYSVGGVTTPPSSDSGCTARRRLTRLWTA